MKKIRRILLVVVVAAVLLVAVGAIALTLDYDSPTLGQALLDQVAAAGGLELEAETFRLNLLEGLELGNVQVRTPVEGGRLEATSETLLLEHQLRPLLSGVVLVEQIVLERPHIELVSIEAPSTSGNQATNASAPATSTASEATPPEGGSTSDLKLQIERIAITDGTLVTRVEGLDEPPTEIRGLDLELRNLTSDPTAVSLVQGLRAEGELTAEELLSGDVRATGAEGTVRLEGGHLLLADCGFETDFGGLVVSQLDLDLNHDPYRFAMTLSGHPLETHPFLGSIAEGFGVGRLSLDLTGDLSETMNLVGLGALAVDTGELPATAVLDALENLLHIQLVGQQHSPFEVGFSIDDSRLLAEPFRIVVGDVELALGGSAGLLDEALSLRLAAIAPRAQFQIDEIPDEVFEALTDVDGRVNLPIVIDGSITQPAIRFDRSAWGQIARGRLQREVEKEVTRGLLRLFGDDEDDEN